MNLEKLGLILFIKYLREFESVKHHLLSATKELLMAMSSTLNITNQITTENFILGRSHTLKSTFKKIESLISYSINQLELSPNRLPPDQNPQLKENIVESIISVIDEEIDKLADSSALNKDLKIEALSTVKDVLHNHLQDDDSPYFDDIIEVEQAASS